MRQSLRIPKKLPERKILSIDIGGTLAKTAFYVPLEYQAVLQKEGKLESLMDDTIPIDLENGDKIFLKSFHSNKIAEFIEYVKHHGLLEEQDGKAIIHATGGGAYKYQDLIIQEFGDRVQLQKHDEMQSLVDGMGFVLNFAKNPSYTFKENEGQIMVENPGKDWSTQMDSKVPDNSTSDYHEIFNIPSDTSDSLSNFGQQPKAKMLVSIGSGVSIIKVQHNGQYERVSGTMIGGGTLVGLSNLLTGIKDFDQICELSQTGDNGGVDMLVKDIYGQNSPFKELSGDALASSFAKVANDHTTEADEIPDKYKKEDMLHSLMFMISFNIGQLAYFSSQIHDIEDIYFVGNYIRNNKLGKEKISYAVDILSMGKTRPLFMTYDGYLGAIGAFLQEFQEKKTE